MPEPYDFTESPDPDDPEFEAKFQAAGEMISMVLASLKPENLEFVNSFVNALDAGGTDHRYVCGVSMTLSQIGLIIRGILKMEDEDVLGKGGNALINLLTALTTGYLARPQIMEQMKRHHKGEE